MDPTFVAVNFITCKPDYRERFEELFRTRAHAIDRIPGFIDMQVLQPDDDSEYLIVSRWARKEDFEKWTGSPEFLEGHKRGFEDIADAKRTGKESPMTSTFRTYAVLAS